MNRVTVGLIVLVLITGACISIGCSSGDSDKSNNKRITGTITSVQISGSVSEGKIVALTYAEGFVAVYNLQYSGCHILYIGKNSRITIDKNGYIINSERELNMSIGIEE